MRIFFHLWGRRLSSSLLVHWNSGDPQTTRLPQSPLCKQFYSNFCQMCLNLSNQIASISLSLQELLQLADSNSVDSSVMLIEKNVCFFILNNPLKTVTV